MLSEYIILPPFLSSLRHPVAVLLRHSLTPFGSLPLALSLSLSLFLSRFVRPSRPDDAVYVVTRYGAQRATVTQRRQFSHSMSLRQHERATNTRYRSETTAQPFGKSVFRTLRTVSLPVSKAQHSTRSESQLGLLRVLRLLRTARERDSKLRATRRGAGGAEDPRRRRRYPKRLPVPCRHMPLGSATSFATVCDFE